MCGILFVLGGCGGGGGSSPAATTPPPSSSTPTPTSTPTPAPTPSAEYSTYNLDVLGVPKFVNTNYIDLTKVTGISRFRSHSGHDYADAVESCRSMKHYFGFPDTNTSILSPVAGIITHYFEEWAGWQIHVKSDAQPAFTFVIFHLAPAKTYAVGDKVTEGQLLGTHIGTQTMSDIAVDVNATNGHRRVSYFETLTDAAFAPYVARGITTRSELIITRSERDAAPLTCNGETFTNADSDPYERWVDF
jgi:hypothetical protein